MKQLRVLEYFVLNIMLDPQGHISYLMLKTASISGMEFYQGGLLDPDLEFLNGVEMLVGPLSCHNHWECSQPF